MTYKVGNRVAAGDYNQFASQLNKMTLTGSGNFGYGNSVLEVINVNVGSTIRGDDFLTLRNRIDDLNVHQGACVIQIASTVLPASDDFESADLIIAYDGSGGRWNLPRNLSNLTAQRLTVDVFQTATGAAHSNVRGTPWNNQVVHEFEAQFSSGDAARHFFNSGGEIKISNTLIGASNAKNDDWRSLLARASSYIFDASVYFAGGLTVNILRLQVSSSAAAYTANDYKIFERRDIQTGQRGHKGRIITFRVEFNDDAVENVDEDVTGTLTNQIDERVSTDRITGSGASYNILVSMSAGG